MKNRNFKLIACLVTAALSISLLVFAAGFETSFTSDSEQGVYTSWDSVWHFEQPGTGTVFFTAQAGQDIHIAISDTAETNDPMYEIVIGGWSNTQSAIRRVSQGDILKSSKKVIKDTEAEGTYWVSLNAAKKTVSAGYGTVAGKDIIIEWKDPKFLVKSSYFAFSSWDSLIEYSNISLAPAK